MTVLKPLIDYAWTQGPTFWLLVAAALLAAEAVSGRAWWIWGAIGAAIASLMTLWLSLNPFVEALAFVAASLLGLVYSLQMRIAAAKRKAQQARLQAQAAKP